MLGAEYIASYLRTQVNKVFTFPGGTIAPIYDALGHYDVPIYVTRHEQGAGYAALAAARITQQPQVVMVTSGPGVTNLMTVLADAFYDSTPLVAFTGQVGTGDLTAPRAVRQKGFQEVNTTELVRTVVKAVFQPMHPDELPKVLEDAFNIAGEGRPGPVVIDIPMDVQRGEMTSPVTGKSATKGKSALPLSDFSAATKLLAQAQRPALLVGQGVLLAKASEDLRQLAEAHNIPVVSTLLGLGAVDGDSPLHLGFVGHTGVQLCGKALQNADCVLILGARLDVRQTGTLTDSFCPHAQRIRIDIDPAELDAPRVQSHLSFHANLHDALQSILQLAPKPSADIANYRRAWMETLESWRLKFPPDAPSLRHEELSGVAVVKALNTATAGKKVIVSTGVGAHQHWVARHFSFNWPERLLLTSGGHGAMGYDIPSIMGAALEKPDHLPLCIVGDASFQINMQELQFAVEHKLPVKIVVLDNNRMAMVSQFQKLTWGSDPTTGQLSNPDFSAIASAFSYRTFKISSVQDLDKTIVEFLSRKEPALMHCKINEADDVIPMLLGGQTLDDMYSVD